MGAEQQRFSYVDLYSKASGAARDLVPISTVTSPIPVEDTAEPIAQDDERRTSKKSQSPFARLTGGLSLRELSPRQMAELSLDLYAAGLVSYDEYELLAFQPELHPDYDTTVGALTGERATPDKPRDFVAFWEERLNFERRYNPQNTEMVRRARRLVELLHQLDPAPTGIAA